MELVHTFGTFLKLEIIDEGHGHKVRLNRMEFNARDNFVFAIFLFKESSGHHIYSRNLLAASFFLVAKHLKIVLENINDFITLQGLFDAEANTVDEFVKLIID